MLDSGVFILGPNVKAFEQEAASYLGVPRTVGVANGTDALVLALDALEVGPGDEVICPAFTFYATAESIARRGATPVFADIDPVTLNLDPEDVAAKVTDRTRALMPVHLFGRVMPLDELAKLEIPIVEDAAQAFGAEGVATTGALSTFSFFPTKNLFALGDGGLVAATDERSGRPGRAPPLPRLAPEGRVRGRGLQLAPRRAPGRRAAPLPRRSSTAGTAPGVRPRPATRSSGSASSASCRPTRAATSTTCTSCARPSATGCDEALAAAEIGHASYYVTPLHLQPALRYLGQKEGSLPETEKAAAENLALPMWAGIPAEVQERVVAVIREAAAVRA